VCLGIPTYPDGRARLFPGRCGETSIVLDTLSLSVGGSAVSLRYSRALSRRGFCICCAAAAGLGANGGWSNPAEASPEPGEIVDLIRDYAAKTPIQLHKLRGNVTIIEGSGGNIAVLTGADGKLFVDAGITATQGCSTLNT
jgi:hypothetical protein